MIPINITHNHKDTPPPWPSKSSSISKSTSSPRYLIPTAETHQCHHEAYTYVKALDPYPLTDLPTSFTSPITLHQLPKIPPIPPKAQGPNR